MWRLANPRRRLWGAFLIVAALFGIVFVRVAELQIVKGQEYQQLAEAQRTRTVPLVAKRGSVLDRNGVALAYTVDARAVYADPSEVTDPASAAETLAGLLDVPEAELEERLTGDRRFVYLARGVDLAVADQVMAEKLRGVNTLPETRRVYPGGVAASGLLGFTDVDGKGIAGVESWQQGTLAGTDGKLVVEAGRQGQRIPNGTRFEVPSVPGSDVRLTIDSEIQYVAQRAIADQVRRFDADQGTVVVMDPRTGEVLAMASTPSADPYRPGEASEEARGNPAVTEALEPGSVNKVVTAAAAIEEGLVTPGTVVVVPPQLQVADKTFTDSHPHGTLRLSFADVVAQSSNIGTIKIAQLLGDERMYSYLRDFGFGEPTGLEFPGEARGLVPKPEDWSGTSLGTIAIGNGVTVNTVHMASVLATIANGGVRVRPTLLLPDDPDGEVEGRRVVSERTADQVNDMLRGVVEPEGTAPQAAIAGYTVAGKTGTARRVVDGSSQYVANFAGFLPAEDPQLVVAVVVENPRNAIFGGTVAAPVFHEVASYAVSRLRIPPPGRAE